MTRSQANTIELCSLVRECMQYFGCACGLSARKPCSQCELIPRAKEVVDRIERETMLGVNNMSMLDEDNLEDDTDEYDPED